MKPTLFALILIPLLVGLSACSAAPATPSPAQPEPSATLEILPSLAPAVEQASTPAVTQVPAASLEPAASSAPAAPRPTLSPDAWQTLPVIPTVSASARSIFQRGLQLGNDPKRFSKIGDCQNVESYFLAVFEKPGEYDLGPDYASLSETIDYYNGSFSRDSLAVKGGYNVAAILTPLRADPKACQKTESPLDCELRAWQPTVAIVSLEEWWADRPIDEYGAYLRKAVNLLINRGVVPILATRAGNDEHSLALNAEIASLAYEYDLPLWNFWLAIQPLENHGLISDGFHLTYARNIFTDPQRMKSAWPWRNLTALQVLDAVRKGLTQ
jgi:hypothetical protein